jgi:Zn-dependent alcohol dehydrogenase
MHATSVADALRLHDVASVDVAVVGSSGVAGLPQLRAALPRAFIAASVPGSAAQASALAGGADTCVETAQDGPILLEAILQLLARGADDDVVIDLREPEERAMDACDPLAVRVVGELVAAGVSWDVIAEITRWPLPELKAWYEQREGP